MPALNVRLTNKALLTFAAWLLFFAASPASSRAKEWRGITPAVSTRSDVVRLFNHCADPKAHCAFETESEGVSITFSGEVGAAYPCAEQLPADTVLLVAVTPKAKLKPSDLSADESSFRKFDADNAPGVGFEGFIDDGAGLLLRTFENTVDGVYYIAAPGDRFRCPSFYEPPERFVPRVLCVLPPPEIRKFAALGVARPGEERAALDKFAAALRGEPGAQAYVIAYAGRRSRAGEARARAVRAKAYLTGTHGMGDGRIVIVDGGYREEAALELFTVPVGANPPAPTPTLDPKDVQLTPDRKAKKPSSR